MQEEEEPSEEVQLASVQVGSEPLLRRNVEGMKLETAHCLKLGQTTNHLIFIAHASSESSGSRAIISFTPQGYIIHVFIVRIVFSHFVCASVFQRHVPF